MAHSSVPACPPAGHGVHRWILSAANHLRLVGVGPTEAMLILRQQITRPPSPANEIEQAVEKAYNSPLIPSEAPRLPSRPKWPVPNVEQISAIVRDGASLADLWEWSPVRVERNATEEIVSVLFPGSSLLCCGYSQSKFATKHREAWRGQLARMQFIVPSPMASEAGLTQDGRKSAHTLNNTGPRRFLVIEFDQGDGDQHAAILRHLAESAPLVLVVHSGGKSLHGWFFCAGEPEDQLYRFMRRAVSLGADPATWTRSQFVRMPDGQRDNGNRQAVLFFNPLVLKP